jgi:beta-glucosidase
MAWDPRWGRNEDTYGEDPYLTSRIGISFVKGLQGDHPHYLKTVATVKHFVANNQKNDRFNSSSQIPEKQLYEYYFLPYEACVKEAGVQSIMSAYNAVNGAPAGGFSWLLNEVLHKEWGFDGFVVSDYRAVGVMY